MTCQGKSRGDGWDRYTKTTLMAASFAVGLRLDLCNAPMGVKGQTLAKRVRLLGKSTGSYGKPAMTRCRLVLRWTSKLGRCLIRQSKRSCSEATMEKAISDKPSTGYVRGVPQRNNEVEMNKMNGVL